jgi:hypothetical protein
MTFFSLQGPWQLVFSSSDRYNPLLQAYHVTDSALSYFSPKQTGTMNVMRLQSCWEITNHGLVNIGEQSSRTPSKIIHVRRTQRTPEVARLLTGVQISECSKGGQDFWSCREIPRAVETSKTSSTLERTGLLILQENGILRALEASRTSSSVKTGMDSI